MGLALHLSSGERNDPETVAAWMGSDDGRAFMTRSSEGWREASVAAGAGADAARAAATARPPPTPASRNDGTAADTGARSDGNAPPTCTTAADTGARNDATGRRPARPPPTPAPGMTQQTADRRPGPARRVRARGRTGTRAHAPV
jgi:hypothetical protein